MVAAPKHLTGDAEGIKEFIDRFDVCIFARAVPFPEYNPYSTSPRHVCGVLTPIPGLPIRLRWCVIPLNSFGLSRLPFSGHLEQ